MKTFLKNKLLRLLQTEDVQQKTPQKEVPASCTCDTADELKLYQGYDVAISDRITVHQPTLGEICRYGEKQYWSMVYTLTSVGADMKFQLFDIGIDYTKIKDFELFYSLLCRSLTPRQTSILFGELDFSKLQLYQRNDPPEIVLYNPAEDICMDESAYLSLANALRKMHGLTRNSKLPANESTKKILIEEAREEYERLQNVSYRSQLKNMVSAMVNSEGFKYNHRDVWNMNIYAFMDSVRRTAKIKNAQLLLQSGYSGFGINLKDVPSAQLDWLGELE